MELSNRQLIETFWNCIDAADFEKLTEVLSPDALVKLPNTRERFVGSQNYIAFNCDYPGRWRARVEAFHEVGDLGIATVLVTNPAENISLYVTSYFEIRDGKISVITEYWGENGDPPAWRLEKGYSERY